MPYIIGTRDDRTAQLLDRPLAIASNDHQHRTEMLNSLEDFAQSQGAAFTWIKNPADSTMHSNEIEQLIAALDQLQEIVIGRITEARRVGNEKFIAKELPPVYLVIDGLCELLRFPSEGEHEWFQNVQKHTMLIERITKLMSANPLADTHIIVADSFDGFAKLSESSTGYELLMKVDSLMLGESTPAQRAGLLRIDAGEDELGELGPESAVYADAEWFHTLILAGSESSLEPEIDFTPALAIYDALAPVLGITAPADQRLVALSNTVAEMAIEAGLEVPDRIQRAYVEELQVAA